MKRYVHLGAIALGILVAAPAARAQDLVIPSGTTLVYDTSAGPLLVKNLILQEGGTLEVVGSQEFFLPPGLTLADVTSPRAHVLAPVFH